MLQSGMKDEQTKNCLMATGLQASFVVWKSSANGAEMVLELCNQQGWEYVRLFYVDASAEEKILNLYTESLGSGGPANNSTDGL